MCWWVFLAIKQSSLKKTLKTKHLVLSVHTYIVGRMCVRLSFQLCPALYDPMDCSPPDSSVHGILQARILEWAAMPSSRGLPDPGIEPKSSALAGVFFTTNATGKALTCL